MSAPYIGEVRLIGFSFAPPGWLVCDGSILSVAQYNTLYALIGTTYGGDGQTTFALPDLRGRVPVHQGVGQSAYVLGQQGGAAAVTLTSNQLAGHSHPLSCSSGNGSSPTAAGNYFAGANQLNVYGTPSSNYVAMGSTVSPAGGNQAHANLQPFQALYYIIATEGIYPSQS